MPIEPPEFRPCIYAHLFPPFDHIGAIAIPTHQRIPARTRNIVRELKSRPVTSLESMPAKIAPKILSIRTASPSQVRLFFCHGPRFSVGETHGVTFVSSTTGSG
jgi:hypothetical protein